MPPIQPQQQIPVPTSTNDDEITVETVPQNEVVEEPPIVQQNEQQQQQQQVLEPTPQRVERTTRAGRRVKPNPKYTGETWVQYATRLYSQKFRFGATNKQSLAGMTWDQSLSLIKSIDARALNALIQRNTYVDHNTIEQLPEMFLNAQVPSEDTPNWETAMSGPLKDGFLKACDKEVDTLENKDCWEVVDRQPWMHVLPSTWAFRIKRFTDGQLRKLKARFCVRGDKQVEGIDFFDTYAPVVNWTTVRLLLILTAILKLTTVQVDYTAAFVHADINKPPNYDNMTAQEKARSGVYIHMPRGYTQPGKVLKLKKSLYGLRQSPRNFFQHLKSKLEKIGFVSQTDVDPCLFISDKVIILVYVDDTLLFAQNREDIDEVLTKLRNEQLELEEEDSVAGFLGVKIEHRDNGSIKLTQKRLDPTDHRCVGSTRFANQGYSKSSETTHKGRTRRSTERIVQLSQRNRDARILEGAFSTGYSVRSKPMCALHA